MNEKLIKAQLEVLALLEDGLPHMLPADHSARRLIQRGLARADNPNATFRYMLSITEAGRRVLAATAPPSQTAKARKR